MELRPILPRPRTLAGACGTRGTWHRLRGVQHGSRSRKALRERASEGPIEQRVGDEGCRRPELECYPCPRFTCYLCPRPLTSQEARLLSEVVEVDRWEAEFEPPCDEFGVCREHYIMRRSGFEKRAVSQIEPCILHAGSGDPGLRVVLAKRVDHFYEPGPNDAAVLLGDLSDEVRRLGGNVGRQIGGVEALKKVLEKKDVFRKVVPQVLRGPEQRCVDRANDQCDYRASVQA